MLQGHYQRFNPTLKKEDLIRAAVTYDGEPAEDESPAAFRAQRKDLEARWAAISPPSDRGKASP